QSLPPVGEPLVESSEIGMHSRQVPAGEHGRQSREAEAFPYPVAVEQLEHPQAQPLGPLKISGPDAGDAEVEVSRHLEPDILQRFGQRLRASAEGERFLQLSGLIEVVAHVDRDLTKSTLVVEGLRQALGVAKALDAPREFREREERRAKVESEIDGLL